MLSGCLSIHDRLLRSLLRTDNYSVSLLIDLICSTHLFGERCTQLIGQLEKVFSADKCEAKNVLALFDKAFYFIQKLIGIYGSISSSGPSIPAYGI
jgi:hypothetical protein